MIARIDLGVLEIDLTGLSGSQADAHLHEVIRERERAAFASLCAQREAAGLADRHCACGGSTRSRTGGCERSRHSVARSRSSYGACAVRAVAPGTALSTVSLPQAPGTPFQ